MDSIRRLGGIGTAALIVSKPSQVLMGLSALKTSNQHGTLFVVMQNFGNFEVFFELLKGHSALDRLTDIVPIKNYTDLYTYYDKITGLDLFVEDDRVSLYNIFTSLKPRTICVFEEGLGTYDPDYWVRRSGWKHYFKAVKWAAIGCIFGGGLSIGSGRKTNTVYCVRPELYAKRHPRLAHKARLIDGHAMFRTHFLDLLERIMPLPYSRNCDAVLYLTGWSADITKNIAFQSHAVGAKFFVKPHPHMQSPPNYVSNDYQVSKSVPAEYLIDYISGHFKNLTVVHYSSAACILYPFQNNNIRFRTLNTPYFYNRFLDEKEISAPVYEKYKDFV